uniref:Uncharacterized protein n=1 Tax=Campylobacter phage vB_CJ12660_3PH123 TaxID=3236702 RepID=A0AB39C5N1_9VIRU
MWVIKCHFVSFILSFKIKDLRKFVYNFKRCGAKGRHP